MSFDLNHVTVIGRLTRDVEQKYTAGGTAVANIGLAVGGKPKPDGTETVSFLDVVAWGKTAETCSKYLAQGKQIAVAGHLEQQRWEDKDGVKHNRVQIIAERVQFLGSKPAASADPTEQPEGAEPGPNDPNF